jgi:hypothetical protein
MSVLTDSRSNSLKVSAAQDPNAPSEALALVLAWKLRIIGFNEKMSTFNQ